MKFLLSEDDLNRLQDINGQLGLMLDLVCAIVNTRQVSIDPENLTAFLAAHQASLSSVIRTVLTRQESQRASAEPTQGEATKNPSAAPARKRERLATGAL